MNRPFIEHKKTTIINIVQIVNKFIYLIMKIQMFKMRSAPLNVSSSYLLPTYLPTSLPTFLTRVQNNKCDTFFWSKADASVLLLFVSRQNEFNEPAPRSLRRQRRRPVNGFSEWAQRLTRSSWQRSTSSRRRRVASGYGSMGFHRQA